MSAPDPEGFSILAKLLGVCAAIGVPIGGAWKYHQSLEEKFDKKANAEEVAKCLGHIEKLYQNAEKDRALTRDLHEKQMERMQDLLGGRK